jgi:ACS family allantoate permease-like MFS transporter
MGFRSDLHLTGDQYAWLGSIFCAYGHELEALLGLMRDLGYLVGEYPLNVGLQKFPLAKYTAVMIVIWGAILCLMAVGGSFRGLMVIRLYVTYLLVRACRESLSLTHSFLGFFESIITPALTIFTSQYYKAAEQGTRTGKVIRSQPGTTHSCAGIWFSFNASGGIVGGALAYGLLHGQNGGHLSIAGWKLIFIILGAFTSFVGILFFILVPDSPDKARFLNEREREVAVLRVASNKTGAHSGKLKPEQVKEALLDPMVGCMLPGRHAADSRPGSIRLLLCSPVSRTEALRSESRAVYSHLR